MRKNAAEVRGTNQAADWRLILTKGKGPMPRDIKGIGRCRKENVC